MTIKTENFNPKTDTKLLCTCGHTECDKRSVQQLILNRVQLIREEAARPLTITSGGRCIHHPDELARVTPADHQNCVAVDIGVLNGFERGQIVELGLLYGFNAIGIAKTFVHLGCRPELKNNVVMWVY